MGRTDSIRDKNKQQEEDKKKFLLSKDILSLDFEPHTKLMSRKSVLLIEDDLDFAHLMSELMEDYADLKVDIAADPYEAMNLLADKVYDFVVLDWFLQDITGKKTIEKVESVLRIDPAFPTRWSSKMVPVVVLSAQSAEHIHPFRGEHFRYKSFISKQQSLKDILDQLKKELGSPYIEEIYA